MYTYDFEYDGQRLSDIGYIICKFDSDGLQTISNGSQISFNTISTQHGTKHKRTSSEYQTCLETTFQICKNPCFSDDLEISQNELRSIATWLNRDDFHKLKFVHEELIDYYFEASFNISRIEIDGVLYGLELHVITNRPFALQEERQILINNKIKNGTKTIVDTSDKEGYIYPYTEITILENGDLSIHNDLEDRTTLIKECKVGEIITMDYPVITSSLESHNLADDFNYIFFRVANSFKDRNNTLTISIPCKIKIKYSPIVKIGL